MSGHLWSVVLAAGAGRRLSGITGGVPKQFWRPDNGPSLLEATLDRLAPVCPPERTVIVVGDEHRDYLRRSPRYRRRGRVLFQPHNRGTAAGVLFGLLPVLAADPDGVVIVTPSDHGVRNQHTFRQGITEAIAHAQHPGAVVLFGVEPSGASDDYGWITVAPTRKEAGLVPVKSFVEKPDLQAATELFTSGSLWNTMVLVARAGALMDLCRHDQPRLAAVFEQALMLPRNARRTFFLETYPTIETVDLSRDVLTHARGLWAYRWPASMGWSDLGTPERFFRWINGPLAGARRDGAPPLAHPRLPDRQTNRPALVTQRESRP